MERFLDQPVYYILHAVVTVTVNALRIDEMSSLWGYAFRS